MRICIPILPAAITVIYAAFAFVMESRFSPDCMQDDENPCSTDDIKGSVAYWGSDAFVAITLFFLTLHLRKCDQRVRKSGHRCQMFMSMAFAVWGAAHWMLPHGSLGALMYLIANGLAFFCATQSLLEHDSFVRAVFRYSVNVPKCCGHRFLKVFQSLSIFAMFGVLAGTVWCSVEINDHFEEFVGIDDDAIDMEEIMDKPMCRQVLFASEHAWYLIYALFWISAGTMVRTAIIDSRYNVDASFLFVPASVAAVTIPAIQCTVGFVFLVYIRVVAYLAEDDHEKNVATFHQEYYGPYIYHYGILMTFVLSHTLAYTLEIPEVVAAGSETSSQDDGSVEGATGAAENGRGRNKREGTTADDCNTTDDENESRDDDDEGENGGQDGTTSSTNIGTAAKRKTRNDNGNGSSSSSMGSLTDSERSGGNDDGSGESGEEMSESDMATVRASCRSVRFTETEEGCTELEMVAVA